MPIALTPHETWDYQLEDDYLEKPVRDKDGNILHSGKPNPDGTWWKLGNIPASVDREIVNAPAHSTRGTDVLYLANSGTVMEMTLENCVKGVRNFRNAKGEDIVIRMKTVNGREVALLDFLDYLLPKHRVELSNAGSGRRKVTVKDSD